MTIMEILELLVLAVLAYPCLHGTIHVARTLSPRAENTNLHNNLNLNAVPSNGA